jgi:anaerobic selenocysteine-containing dehydrogenase
VPATRIHYRACNLCEAICGIAIELAGDRITAIRGDADDVFSRGHVCPKAVALKDVHEDPDRIRRPLRRTPGGWQEISWAEALDEAAARIHAIQSRHGRHALAAYVGNPTVHNHGLILFNQLFLRALHTRNLYSATSVDQLPHMLASLLMFGHQLLFPVPDVDRTSYFLILGGNPLASNGSMMTAPGIERRLKALCARGGTLVVVDPRRTETAAMATQHLAIRPGSDALLLLALLQTLFAEELARPGRLAAFSDGFDDVRRAVAAFPPERVAERTGLSAATIRNLARAFAAAPSAVAYGRVGLSTQAFGGLCQWLLNVLNVVTGNLDREGGALFARPAVDVVSFASRIGQRGGFDRRKSRVRGLPEFGGELPVATLADEIETPGDGQVRGLVTIAGNPVLSAPNGGRLDRAFSGLELMIGVDCYLNETTRHAHLILPPTSALERDHYDVVFHLLAVRNTAKYSPPLFAKPADSRHDWEILLELATRLEALRGRRLRATLTRALMGRLGPSGIVAWLLRTGPYGAGYLPFGRGLTLGRLKKAPHGVDLGPLTPCLPDRLATEDHRIRLAPERFVRDLERLEQSLAQATPQLVMIGRRDIRSNNSWMHNSERLVKGRDRCTLLMHPDDARERGLAHGQRVSVRSRVGAADVALEVTDSMRPGVVSLPHGFGHGREGVRLRIAQAHAGVSVNDLNDDALVDALCGTAAFSGVPVEVSAAAG